MTREQLKQLEDDLWATVDNLRANSDLKASEYGTPVLGLIFLKFADINYRRHEAAIRAEFEKFKGGRREKPIHEIAIAKCGFFLPEHAHYSYLLNLPEDQDIAKAIETAMTSIEEYKPELEGSLPKDEYYRLTRTPETKHLPFDLLRQFDNIPDDASGDVFGQIYEYFLGKFAMAEGQGGGEFFTPRSVVRLMVEIIEPHGGTVFDPACGSGGMFVQSADFIAKHQKQLEAQGKDTSVFVYGQEKQSEKVKLARCKEKMTQAEEKKVRLAEKELLKRLTKESPKVLVQDWYKDSQTRLAVRDEVASVLDKYLPEESYGKDLFIEKWDRIFELTLDLAINHLKWAA